MDPIVALAEGLETSALEHAAQYGVVGFLCVVFAIVIHRLYKENRGDRKEAAEREKAAIIIAAEKDKAAVIALTKCQDECRIENEKLRADFERRHREILEGYSAQLSQARVSLEKREDEIRRETMLMVERLANSNREANEALVEMLEQMLHKVMK